MTATVVQTRTRKSFSVPSNQVLTAAFVLPLDLAAQQTVHVDWSALLSANNVPTNTLVSFMLKETTDPNNLSIGEGKILNFTSYATVVPSGRTPVGGGTTFVATATRVHNLVAVLAAYRSGAPAGEALTLNSIEATAAVENA